MKRDVDLIRQIMFEIERGGAECSVNALRNGAGHEADERTRYHLRLRIDPGLAKEIDHTSAATPCVRLTAPATSFSSCAAAMSVGERRSGSSTNIRAACH